MEEKSRVKNSVSRLIFVALSLLIQIAWLILQIVKLNEYYAAIALVTSLISTTVALRIYGKHENAAFKMPWIIALLLFPVLGLCLYVLFGRMDLIGRKKQRQFAKLDQELFPMLAQGEGALQRLERIDFRVANQCRYIERYGGFPVYDDTQVHFYGDAAEAFEAQLLEIRNAKEFIFMEYHAIEEAEAFGRLRDLLAEKAAAGVEVRLFYDDVGSVGFINVDFVKRMEALGIQCRIFNPVMPVINRFMNNRDHRKITVIDGRVGFTGGYNLADEYFNITHPYGHWKDTGVKLAGNAVRNLTALFLEMWNAMQETDGDLGQYLKPSEGGAVSDAEPAQGDRGPMGTEQGMGFVQPYGDSPLDGEPMGENVYLNLIKCAKHKLYVATPYLIISDEMNQELGLAAKRGVDVRVLTPGIPDKKMIYKVTRSYYAGLARQGVRIYEYTPGFLHEKQMLCDHECAVVGTINLDYRSLYHHFENGVFLYGCSAIKDIAADFDATIEKCTEVTQQYRMGRSAVLRVTQCILRLFAPLL